MRTPHIQKLKTSGGTLYTFATANEDLSNLIIDSSKVFKFSKFVCLDLPDIVNGKCQEHSDDVNNICIDTYSAATTTSIDLPTKFKRNLQNYILNFETFFINQGNESSAEQVFFNWLYNVGGISFTEVTENDEYTYSTNLDGHYKESATQKTVKYIGNIDIINKSNIEGYSFTQVYLTIPTEAGGTPKIIFNGTDGGKFEVKTDASITKAGNIIGTLEDNEDYLAYYDEEGDTEVDGIYYADKFYSIDFAEEDYKELNELSGIKDFEHYNMSSTSDDFEFNTILLYYDIFDRQTGLSETKLYGVLFILTI